MPLLLLVAAVARLMVSPPPPVPEPVSELELRWDVPEGCPTSASVREYVADYLDPGVSLRELSAVATVRDDGSRWTLSLRFDGQDRELDAATCDDLARATAVILSLALAPGGATGVSAEPEPEEPPSAASEDEDETEPASPIETPVIPRLRSPRPAPEPPQPRPRPSPPTVRGLVRPEAAIGVGVVPTLTTARLAVGVAWPRARVEVAGTLWAPADAPGLLADDPSALVTMGSVHAHGCGVVRGGVLRFPLCGGVALGAVRVDDLGASPRATTHRLWAGATASAALIWFFRPYAGLWVGPELTVALREVSVPLTPSGLYQTGPIAIRGAVGVEFQFPSRVDARAGNTGR